MKRRLASDMPGILFHCSNSERIRSADSWGGALSRARAIRSADAVIDYRPSSCNAAVSLPCFGRFDGVSVAVRILGGRHVATSNRKRLAKSVVVDRSVIVLRSCALAINTGAK